MKLLATYLFAMGFILGLLAAYAGFYLLFGLDWTLLVGGLALAVACFLVDV